MDFVEFVKPDALGGVMEHKIDRDKFVTISQLTALLNLGVTYSAVRRNIVKYPEYFNSQFVRGVQYVEKEPALKVYKIIHGALAPGKNRGGQDVYDALKKENVEPIPKAESDQPDVIPVMVAGEKEVTLKISDKDWERIENLLKGR